MKTVNKYNFSCVVLAAGKGTRMRSTLPKVLHKIAGKPLIAHVLSSVAPLVPVQVVTVVAPHMEDVQRACGQTFPACQFAVQLQQKGTGDAVRAALPLLDKKATAILVLYGDTPLMRSETLAAVLEKSAHCDIAVLGMRVENPSGYGRLVTGENGWLEQIVECKDASSIQKKITLCNSGIMVIRSKILPDLLAKLSNHNASKELYLTDIIAHANHAGYRCAVVEADTTELSGINTRAQLADAEHVLQMRLRALAMENGATLVDPSTVYFSADTMLGSDVVVHPFVVFGEGVKVGNHVEIRSYSHIEGTDIASGATIGPFARLRPGTKLEENAHVGNFVELKATRLGRGAKANHLAYIGDADVGAAANIGAGTITCNYDGVNKYRTTIGEGAFIGSNSALVAPVSIGSGAMVGAGSVITDDVVPNALAIARAAQIVKPDRTKRTKTPK